jgi:hypothetical protein
MKFLKLLKFLPTSFMTNQPQRHRGTEWTIFLPGREMLPGKI